jgi:hypothetical protein
MADNATAGTQQSEKKREHEDAGYHTYPVTTTHGPKDKSCYHGKPEDWKRMGIKRVFNNKKTST